MRQKPESTFLVCLSASPSNAKVVRTAARMAEAFHSGFTALFVETSETKELKGESLKRLRDNMRLAEQLGAQITTVYGDEPAVQIAEYARVSGITKIVVGRTNHNTVAGFGTGHCLINWRIWQTILIFILFLIRSPYIKEVFPVPER